MSGDLLESLNLPGDLTELKASELEQLSSEVREIILHTVAEQGGHLASNLGVIELTVALLNAFDIQRDRIVWDTSHQAYAYKLLTGRLSLFRQLRALSGASGFATPEESDYDQFGAGHAGTAISAATGFAAARDRLNSDEKVVAVVGDGALGCGVALEGLNNLTDITNDVTVILNDNKMSISPNVGALSRYLSRVLSADSYNSVKELCKHGLDSFPIFGKKLHQQMHRMETAVKGMFTPGSVFEELGFRYIGPLNGHDLHELTSTFERIQHFGQPLVVHVVTQKGHGYRPAERQPSKYHSTGSFSLEANPEDEGSKPKKKGKPFSKVLGDFCAGKCIEDRSVMTVTAGMSAGTGMETVREHTPDQFFDVGIAEEHAAVFAAGLSKSGLKPIVAIYATFMQRAVDYVFHDVCLQKLPVVFCLDRAGVVDDGPTHHGIHDLAFWRACPGLNVLQPADDNELKTMLEAALGRGEPTMVRYPKGDASSLHSTDVTSVDWGRAETLREGKHAALWCVGRETQMGLEVAERLSQQGIELTVVNVRFVQPLDTALLMQHVEKMPIITLEDHYVQGGFGTIVDEPLMKNADGHADVLHLGYPAEIIPWGKIADIRQQYQLDADGITQQIQSFFGK